MIEKWRESLDQGGAYGALLKDLSKAFDCLPHELIIAKLYAYGEDMPTSKLINFYLSKRRQRIKINNVYSSWSEILFGAPPGFILGPLLFNIFICDLLSARASSEAAKRNSVFLEISFDRSLSLIETSQLICVANWLTGSFVMRKVW